MFFFQRAWPCCWQKLLRCVCFSWGCTCSAVSLKYEQTTDSTCAGAEAQMPKVWKHGSGDGEDASLTLLGTGPLSLGQELAGEKAGGGAAEWLASSVRCCVTYLVQDPGALKAWILKQNRSRFVIKLGYMFRISHWAGGLLTSYGMRMKAGCFPEGSHEPHMATLRGHQKLSENMLTASSYGSSPIVCPFYQQHVSEIRVSFFFSKPWVANMFPRSCWSLPCMFRGQFVDPNQKP